MAGLGYADVENRTPCKADTLMRIASISKSLTMAAVAKAMEKGELDLDKPVQFYVPQFPEKIVSGEKVSAGDQCAVIWEVQFGNHVLKTN